MYSIAPLLIAALITGCSDGAALNLTSADNGRTVNAGTGDQVTVLLQTIGPGEYAVSQISSSAVRFTGMGDAGLQNPGGPRQLFMFEAVQLGRATINLAQTAQPLNFVFTVNVVR